MLHLLTFGVLVFQLAILVTIIGFSYISRRWMNVITLVWIAFTLFGSIYTFGLLLLQLFTIVFAYGIACLIVAKKRAPSVT